MSTQTNGIEKDKQMAPINNIRSLLEKSKPQIQIALPRYMNADRMVRVAMTSIQRNPKLLECDPITLAGAIIQSAQLGLEPDGALGMAYLVPFWNTGKKRFDVQFIPGYKGLIDLVRRSEELRDIDAHPVYEKDKFTYAYGLNPVLDHVPSELKDRGEITHFYAYAHLKNEGFQFNVMTRAEVDHVRDTKSKSKFEGKIIGPWATDYEEMGKKTVLRRLCKLLPMRIECLTAVSLDERHEAGIPQDLGMLANEDEKPTPSAEMENDAIETENIMPKEKVGK